MRTEYLRGFVGLLALLCLTPCARGATAIYTIQGSQLFKSGSNVLGLNSGQVVYQMAIDAAGAPYYTSNSGGNLVADYHPLSATLTLTGTQVDGTYTATSPGIFEVLNNGTGDDEVVLQNSSFTVGTGQTITATFEPNLKPGVLPDGSNAPPLFSADAVDTSINTPIAETFQGNDNGTIGLYKLAAGASATSVPEPTAGLLVAGCAMAMLVRRRPGVPT